MKEQNSNSIESVPFAKSEVDNQLALLAKLEQQRSERLADVNLDRAAMTILELLDRETSVKWSGLSKETGLDWPGICRGISLLSSAGLCESGSKRVRLSEIGDRLLSYHSSNG